VERKSFGGLLGRKEVRRIFACMRRKVNWCLGIEELGLQENR
jgi:hypothetical protein